MNIKEVDNRVERLFKEWKSLQPIRSEYKEKFDRKIRLEWNYNSNRIEGNTLTYHETELLIMHDIHSGEHTGRNYIEMKAHDLAIKKVFDWACDKSRQLTQTDIRNLNEIILKEPFWIDAQTTDGKPTKKRIIPGQYKEQPNHVKTASGEIYKFAEPWEVPSKMDDLLKWFNEYIDSGHSSISSFIANLHHRFIIIHPFDDGNGRVVRLWINYVLLCHGYPPIVVRDKDKENYYVALRKADTGDLESLAVYLGKLLILWLEIGIKAGRGEDVSESSDIDKEVELYVREQKNKNLDSSVAYSKKTEKENYDDFLKPFLTTFENKFSSFSTLFESRKITALKGIELLPFRLKSNPHYPKIENLNHLCDRIENNIIDRSHWQPLNSRDKIISFEIFYESFKGKETKSTENFFNMSINISFSYYKHEYEIKIVIEKGIIVKEIVRNERYYSPWGEKKIIDFVAEIKKEFFLLLKK